MIPLNLTIEDLRKAFIDGALLIGCSNMGEKMKYARYEQWINDNYGLLVKNKSDNGCPDYTVQSYLPVRNFMVMRPEGEDWEQMSIAFDTYEKAKIFYDMVDRARIPHPRIMAELKV